MSPTITDSKELAARAADEIERRGWHEGDLSNNSSDPENCKVCVLGATGAAYFGNPLDGYGDYDLGDGTKEYLNLIDEIGRAVVPPGCRRSRPAHTLYAWNDTHVAHQDDPQAYIISELRRYAESA